MKVYLILVNCLKNVVCSKVFMLIYIIFLVKSVFFNFFILKVDNCIIMVLMFNNINIYYFFNFI